MADSTELKERAKQAAGDPTGSDELKREGRVDRAAGRSKEAVENTSDGLKELLHRS